MARLRLTPGSARTAILAVDLFGVNRVIPGAWTTPVLVYINGLLAHDIEAGKKLLEKEGITVEEEM